MPDTFFEQMLLYWAAVAFSMSVGLGLQQLNGNPITGTVFLLTLLLAMLGVGTGTVVYHLFLKKKK